MRAKPGVQDHGPCHWRVHWQLLDRAGAAVVSQPVQEAGGGTKGAPNPNARETFNTAILFPPGVDYSPLSEAVNACAISEFKENMTPQGFVWYGLKSPFHDQAEKTLKYKGYQAGAVYFGSSSEYKPRTVDPGMNDIIDETRVYPGVWAIVAVNPYPFNNVSKGVSLGLQSVMIIADDDNIGGGGAVDPRAAFAGVKIDATVNVAAGFGVPPPTGAVPVVETNEQMLRRMGLL